MNDHTTRGVDMGSDKSLGGIEVVGRDYLDEYTVEIWLVYDNGDRIHLSNLQGEGEVLKHIDLSNGWKHMTIVHQGDDVMSKRDKKDDWLWSFYLKRVRFQAWLDTIPTGVALIVIGLLLFLFINAVVCVGVTYEGGLW